MFSCVLTRLSSVLFAQAEQIESIMLQRSGKPGYLDGERLLAGFLTDLYPMIVHTYLL